jgi:hypothetical protein
MSQIRLRYNDVKLLPDDGNEKLIVCRRDKGEAFLFRRSRASHIWIVAERQQIPDTVFALELSEANAKTCLQATFY